MWNSENSEKLFWSDTAKMLLVGLIKKYPDSIRDVRGSRKDFDKEKRHAWDLIFNDLVDYGMPTTTLEKVKSIWCKMKSLASDAQKKSKRNQKANPMNKVQKAVIDLIDHMNKESQHLMPMPITIKTEPMDEDDTNHVQETPRILRARKSTSSMRNKKTQKAKDNALNNKKNSTANATASMPEIANISNTDPDIKGNLNPVVLLNRLPNNNQFNGRRVNEESANYWNLMTEHEKERMTFERELHRKNIELMDLKVRIEREKLDAMAPRLFE